MSEIVFDIYESAVFIKIIPGDPAMTVLMLALSIMSIVLLHCHPVTHFPSGDNKLLMVTLLLSPTGTLILSPTGKLVGDNTISFLVSINFVQLFLILLYFCIF